MTHQTGFTDAFYSLPAKDTRYVRKLIMEEMGWQRWTFYKKLNGQIRLRKPEEALLRQILTQYGIEL